MIWFCIGCGTFDILFFFLFYSELPNSASPIRDFINIEYWKLWMCEIKERTAKLENNVNIDNMNNIEHWKLWMREIEEKTT